MQKSNTKKINKKLHAKSKKLKKKSKSLALTGHRSISQTNQNFDRSRLFKILNRVQIFQGKLGKAWHKEIDFQEPAVVRVSYLVHYVTLLQNRTHVYSKMRQLLHNVTFITKCDTKFDFYYKTFRYKLQLFTLRNLRNTFIKPA